MERFLPRRPTFVIDATAGATGDGSVAKVEFFNGTTLLGTDTTSSYSFAWNNVARVTTASPRRRRITSGRHPPPLQFMLVE
jgi:hypothetical protein